MLVGKIGGFNPYSPGFSIYFNMCVVTHAEEI